MRTTFAQLAEGAILGEARLAITPTDLALWGWLAGTAPLHDGFHPPGLVAALMMRGYMRILPDRPPGNIHARQSWDWRAPVPMTVAAFVYDLRCHAKEVRGDRLWVHLKSSLRAGGTTYVGADTHMVWAA